MGNAVTVHPLKIVYLIINYKLKGCARHKFRDKKMKKIIFTIIVAVMLSSCGTAYRGVYTVGLSEVERPENIKERYGESKIVNFEEEGKTKYSYEDELIKIVWIPQYTQFLFKLENKSDNTIKIIWDEAAYVDVNGSSGRIMHSGVKYIDKNNSQPPTVVTKKSSINDVIVPTENIYYESGQYGGWQEKPLFVSTASSEEILNNVVKKYLGKTVKILLPLQIQETVNEYIFSFKIEGFNRK